MFSDSSCSFLFPLQAGCQNFTDEAAPSAESMLPQSSPQWLSETSTQDSIEIKSSVMPVYLLH